MSLIELMVALALGVFLLLGLVTLAATGSQSQAVLSQLSRQLDNARYGLEVLSDDIEHAGFYGHFEDDTAPATLAPCTLTLANLDDAVSLPLEVYNDDNAGVPCVSDANYVDGTDIVVVRRADSVLSFDGSSDTVSGLDASTLYIQGNLNAVNIAKGGGDGGDAAFSTTAGNNGIRKSDGTTNAAEVRRYHVFIYFVSPCNVFGSGNSACAADSDDGDPVPTLKRLRLTDGCVSGAPCVSAGGGNTSAGAGTLVWEIEALAEGFENLQLDYGIDGDGDAIPDSGNYTSNVTSAAVMADIVAVNIYALARSRERTPDITDQKSYVLGNSTTVTPSTDGDATNDNYRRNNFNTTVRVKNVAMRRES